MGELLRLGVGIMANAASMLLYAAPILTFSKIMKKKSTEGFSCVPYVLALFNSLIYSWYGLPVVSYQWENFLLVTINGLGVFLEASFIIMYFYYATSAGRKKAAMVTLPIMLIISSVITISAFVFHDHHHRKEFVGSIGLVASVSMYASPLVVMKQVIATKSVKFMPFSLSFFSFLSSSLWMVFGILSHDIFIMSPNFIGTPLSIFQLILYCKYRKRGVMEEPEKWDVEKENVQFQEDQVEEEDDKKKIQHLQLVITNDKIISDDKI
ncbi:hypothetical protein LIER_34177 [Lithospermum erythrorhizon]|uniref:Bidirectional sugar transporter SWEET n=1 Tax=Lithospermum erythrorhizon TaxID=34254 RepID=A0AAV3S2C2_LITER